MLGFTLGKHGQARVGEGSPGCPHPRAGDHPGQHLPGERIGTDFTPSLSVQGQQGSSEDRKEIAPVIHM